MISEFPGFISKRTIWESKTVEIEIKHSSRAGERNTEELISDLFISSILNII